MVFHYPFAEGEALNTGIPSDRDCLLITLGERLPDYSLLHHLTVVFGVEVERLRAENERHLRLGSELLGDLLQRRLYREQTKERLEEPLPGFDLDDAVVSVTSSEGLATGPIGLFRGHDSRLPVCAQGQEIILLYQAGLAPTLQEALDSSLGVSVPLRRAERCAKALREACLALARSHSRRPLCRYAELDDEAPWLPRSLAEAERAFRLVLGALHSYDAANGSALLYTLQAFLEENRSWLNAAQRLHIHKQSLVYRIRHTEEVSGRLLDGTADVATLWFTLQATRLSSEVRNRTTKSSLLKQSAHHGGDTD